MLRTAGIALAVVLVVIIAGKTIKKKDGTTYL